MKEPREEDDLFNRMGAVSFRGISRALGLDSVGFRGQYGRQAKYTK